MPTPLLASFIPFLLFFVSLFARFLVVLASFILIALFLSFFIEFFLPFSFFLLWGSQLFRQPWWLPLGAALCALS